MAPKITLYFLQASRCIRTAWLLELLGLDYEVVFADRENGVAPQWLKDQGGGLGKFPTIKDGDVVLYESGNITEYLCDKYDTHHRFLAPPGDPKRYATLQWVHASEGTFALHALAVLYNRWHQQGGDVAATQERLSKNVKRDLDYLVTELGKSGGGKFLHGDAIDAGDVMMQFTVDFLLTRELGATWAEYHRLKQYVKDCEEDTAYKKAVAKTGHKL